ncbi:MAG: AraC family transcriptional regulator [Pseudomonas marincola]
MADNNQFEYCQSKALPGVSLLDAQMSNFSYSRHTHQEYSFGATCSGEQHFSCNGEFHKSHSGNVISFNPDMAHDGQSGADDNLIYSMLYISPDQMHPLLQAANMSGTNEYRLDKTLINDPKLHRQILTLSTMIRSGSSNAADQEAALFDIAVTLAHHNGCAASEDKLCSTDWRLARITEYIHAHSSDPISIETLANIAGLSKYHFLRLFRDHTGITPWQYIVNYRVNQARLALEKGGKIVDVAFDYGFSDHSHFNRQFKSIYGTTPKKWQQNWLAIN